MGVSTRGRFALVASLVLLIVADTSNAAKADARDCSGSLPGEVATEPFRFRFGSLSSSKDSTHYYIIHCLRSEASARPMRFKWDKTGLQGVIGPGRVAFAKQEYVSGDFEHSSAGLWYGDASIEVPTQVLVPRRGVHPPGNTVTEARLIVPQDFMLRGSASFWLRNSADANLQSLLELKGNDPGQWQAIDIDFESLFDTPSATASQSLRITVAADPTWRNEQPNLWLAIEDPELHARLFGSPVAVPLRRPRGMKERWLPAGVIGEGDTEVILRSQGPVRAQLHSTQLSVYGPDARTILASAPLLFRK